MDCGMYFERILLSLVLSLAVGASTAAMYVPEDTGKVAAADYQAVFYVSPDGSDTADGSKEAPFQTLTRARDAVRKINANMSGDICVYLRGGTYRITEPITLDPQDSGTNGHQIIYQAYEDEVPLISGAVQVTGWKKYNDKLYCATLDRGYKLRNLYVNDHRANMASKGATSTGGYGDYNISKGQTDWAWDSGKKSDGSVYNSNEMPTLTKNWDDLEIINGTTWNENIVCVREGFANNGSVVLLYQQPYGAIAQTPGWGAGFSVQAYHTIYNAFEFLDSAGEFYYDKTDKMLYYYPYDWEDMSQADVEAPIAETLLDIAGENTSNRVKNISVSGITFAHTDYMLQKVGNSYGKTTCQGANAYTAFADSNWHSKKYEMCTTLPAIIHVQSSESINITDNVIKHSGADGICMPNDVVNCDVSRNYITDITSSGITISNPQHIYIGDGDGSNREMYPRGVEGVCKNITVTNNMLHDISVVHGFGGCAAITAYYPDSVKILHNTIKKTAYNGIHLGWGWCNFQDSTTCKDNEISYNRVIDSLNRLHDSGGIYTIGQMPGTKINENYIQGIPPAGSYQPTYGLHNDEGTAYIEENDNVLEISPNVTYTINCEDYGQKHDLTILRTYATANKMGKNPPSSTIDTPIVISDNVWPFQQYKFCVASGIEQQYSNSVIPKGLFSEADTVLPASGQAKGGMKFPIRSTYDSSNVIWMAPDSTSSFAVSSKMTKAAGDATSIMTPTEEGEYRIYVLDASGKVLSKSDKLIRVKGSAEQVDAVNYDVQSGTQNETCSDGGQDLAYIDNGDYVGYKEVEFGTKAVTSMDIRVASANGGTIEVHLDGADGKLIGQTEVGNTGGWQTWKTATITLDGITGAHDLYFVFKGGDGSLLNVQWWKLNGVSLEPIATTTTTTTAATTTTTTIALTEATYGDVNVDDKITIADVVLLSRYVNEEAGISISAQGFRNADCNHDGEYSAEDSTQILLYIARLISKLS